MNSIQQARYEQLSAMLAESTAATGTLGAVVAIRDGDGAWYHLASGQRTPAETQPPRGNGWFPIFSITKTVVATACLRFFAAKGIALSTPLRHWYPHPRIAPEVTLHALLNHTSGLPDYAELEAYHAAVRAAPGTPWKTAQILQLAFDQGRWGAIGAWRYSNPNYWLLGAILERESGQALADVLRDWVFAPAGISELVYPPTPYQCEPTFSAYLSDSDAEIEASALYNTAWAGPAGAVIGTAPGIASLLIALCETDLLTQAQRETMLQSVPIPGNHPAEMSIGAGCGIFVQAVAGLGRLVGHGGGGPGCHTLVKYALEQRIAGAAIVNNERIDPDRLLFPLLRRLMSEPTCGGG
ncbi:MAG: beta-lactamase family protein [Blastochloris sp.]|nr:beta-lactamase family protein [Blastochloris sp.]